MTRQLQIGDRVGDYRIVGFLGAGGMGAVYHGVHTKIDRPAAIKMLTNVVGNSTFKQRFFNEARVQSSLHHPNIATLYDFQESGDELYIVMEYVDGETLEAMINRRYFSVEDALRTFESVCEAVAFIHSNNIVHRDIKPQNIKLSSAGTVKLLDFGIAKDSVSAGLTRIGGVIGTPNYLAPEQLFGNPATQLSDVWALGVLFYEMLTGMAPFKGTTIEQLHIQITTAKFEDPSKINPAVISEVSKIVSKCMSVDAGQRYQSLDEVLVDIRRAKRRYEPEEVEQSASPMKRLFGGIRERKLRLDEANGEPANFPFAKVGLIACSGLVLLVAVGLGIWAMSNSGNTANDSGSQSGSAPAVRLNSTNLSKSSAAQNKEQLVQGGTRPRVMVDVTEGAAEVYRDGQLIGTTPIEIDGIENESVNLTFKRAGYEERHETIDITTRRRVFTFSLRRK